MGATVTEDGTPVASLHESIQHNSEEKKKQNKSAKTRDTVVAFATAFVTNAAPTVQETITEQTLKKQQVSQTPTPQATSFDVVSSTAS